ncbi:MAG TPA: hypothetical protein VGG92_20510 [Caulobacteraceae bacterium]
MNFSIAEIMRRLWAPQHELSCSPGLWNRLLAALRERGGGRHESGAFLLGLRDAAGRARIHDFVLYDDLDSQSLATGIVRFDGRYFSDLWGICERRGLEVVADVHTHPGGSWQSASDQAHPMIARDGHLALIVPDFAKRGVRREEVGVYRYRGAGRWDAVPPTQRRRFFTLCL